MTNEDIDDETLMAYADGELDAFGVARVEAAVRDDPEISGRLALFTRTRAALSSAAAIRRQEPVSDEIVSRAQAAIDAARPQDDTNVVSVTRRDQQWRVWPSAIAASFAVAGLLGGYVLASREPGGTSQGLRFAMFDTPGLNEALSSIPAGARTTIEGGEIAVIASFRDGEGAFCREFELDAADATTVVSVACWNEGGWNPRIAVVGAAGDGTLYAPASSFETLDAYLAAIDADAPMSRDQEAAALNDIR